MKQFLSVILALVCIMKVSAQNDTGTRASVKPRVKTIQPKIMVIPRISNGQDMKVLYDEDMNIQIALSKINEAFLKRGANLKFFDQALKQVRENIILNKAPAGSQEDMKAAVLQEAGADIYVEAKLDIVTHKAGNAKSVTVILEAYQTGTSNGLSSKAFTGPMFQTDDIGKLTMLAIDKEAEAFLDLLQQKFDDLYENGQSVYVEFSLAQESKYTFDFEIDSTGKLLSEMLDDWFGNNAVHGVYNNQGVTSSKMIISDVRIPLLRPDNRNLNYTGQNLFNDIRRFLKSIGVECRRTEGTNNKILITIL